MIQKKNLFVLSALAALAISCTLTNATTGAAVLNTPTGTPPASQHAQPMQSPTPRPQRCTVTANALNVRNCAGVDCGIIAQVTQGAILTVISTADGWHEIKTKAGAVGFVNSNYCKIGE